MMEPMDPMKKALQARRGKGIDISILVGPSDDDDKKTDLAPKPESPLKAEMPPSQMPSGDQLGDLKSEDIMSGMSDGDMKDMSGRQPRSLGERARQAMMEKLGK